MGFTGTVLQPVKPVLGLTLKRNCGSAGNSVGSPSEKRALSNSMVARSTFLPRGPKNVIKATVSKKIKHLVLSPRGRDAWLAYQRGLTLRQLDDRLRLQ